MHEKRVEFMSVECGVVVSALPTYLNYGRKAIP